MAFWADINTNISTIHRPIADTAISKIFKSCFLFHYQKYNVFYALLFSKTSKINIYELKFFNLQ